MRLVLAGFRGRARAHMGHRGGEGDASAQAPHQASVQPLLPPGRAYASHSVVRRIGSTLGTLAMLLILRHVRYYGGRFT